jgi:hypothetical protein
MEPNAAIDKITGTDLRDAINLSRTGLLFQAYFFHLEPPTG